MGRNEYVAMFLLRCFLWLSVVYGAIFFGVPWQGASRTAVEAATSRAASRIAPSGVAAAGADGAGLADIVAGTMASASSKICRQREAECVRDAADLTALVESAIVGMPDYVVSPGHRSAPPSPDPRRRGRLTPRA